MGAPKLDVTIISPQAYARAPWNKYHWRISRPGAGPGQPVASCCADATREGRSCVGFGSRKEALEAGSARRAGLLDSIKMQALSQRAG
jgi:hypothetical protein